MVQVTIAGIDVAGEHCGIVRISVVITFPRVGTVSDEMVGSLIVMQNQVVRENTFSYDVYLVMVILEGNVIVLVS